MHCNINNCKMIQTSLITLVKTRTKGSNMKKVCKTIMNRTLQDNSPITNFSSLLPISLFSLASHLTISLFPFFYFFSWLNQLHFILERKRKKEKVIYICENIMYLVHLFILLQKTRFVCT
jgi:hypothetical protein